ncbi:hypothetical protein HCN44_009085 [Aphidius gifuensis]|uniref:Large ribosomal subunit protein mL44 n=1 Tax=Aphidius gifuensis TaxID=684658 RepID=A0A834XQ54_APHGI|nr:39S ribosomal protein L44, mitochondrial [Aphidius gifuensis]KAF7990096.1 hypothetical protein HCN44_009085 [Aphidius gifuensis]
MNAFCLCPRVIIRAHMPMTIDSLGKRYIKRHVAPTFKEIGKRKKQLCAPLEPVRSSFLEWNYDAEIYAFNQRLTEKFDSKLLVRALTHRSYVVQQENEERKVGIEDHQITIDDNQELINVGSTLTSKIVKIYLSLALPRAPKECIQACHDHLLTEEVLARSSLLIGTKDIILTEESPPLQSTLANTFLALVAALSKSTNEVHAGKFVRDFILMTLTERDLAELWCPENPIKILNKILANETKEPVEPRLITQCGVNSVLPAYQIALYSKKEYLAEGIETSVEKAMRVASLNALYDMFGISSSSKPIAANIIVDPSSNPVENLPLNEWCTRNATKLMEKRSV